MEKSQEEPRHVLVSKDSRLQARIISRQELMYAQGAEPEYDRPAFVRAASGLALLGDELVIVQDDASFLAFVRPGEAARALMLPAGPGGRRRFEDELQNKKHKLDLESIVVLANQDRLRLLAFGSGSLPIRECILSYTPGLDAKPSIVQASSLYSALRQSLALCSDSMNLEGAAVMGDKLRLFQRGNGASRGFPASVDLDLKELLLWLDSQGEPPRPGGVRLYNLGRQHGVAYGFSDACTIDDKMLGFLACAEASPNPVDDGDILGSQIGILSGDSGRWTELVDESGKAAAIKAEGLLVDPTHTDVAWVVLDPDDPNRAAELCRVELDGPWF